MERIRHATAETSVGRLTLAADGDELTGVYFPHHWRRPAPAALGAATALEGDALLTAAAAEVREYLDGRRRSFDVTTRAIGDGFEVRVWGLLHRIPYGGTTTYGALASALGDVRLAFLVGQAVGRNPLSIVVPCHRVLGKDGRLTGYAGGLDRKRALLALEEQERPDRLF